LLLLLHWVIVLFPFYIKLTFYIIWFTLSFVSFLSNCSDEIWVVCVDIFTFLLSFLSISNINCSSDPNHISGGAYINCKKFVCVIFLTSCTLNWNQILYIGYIYIINIVFSSRFIGCRWRCSAYNYIDCLIVYCKFFFPLFYYYYYYCLYYVPDFITKKDNKKRENSSTPPPLLPGLRPTLHSDVRPASGASPSVHQSEERIDQTRTWARGHVHIHGGSHFCPRRKTEQG